MGLSWSRALSVCPDLSLQVNIIPLEVNRHMPEGAFKSIYILNYFVTIKILNVNIPHLNWYDTDVIY